MDGKFNICTLDFELEGKIIMAFYETVMSYLQI